LSLALFSACSGGGATSSSSSGTGTGGVGGMGVTSSSATSSSATSSIAASSSATSSSAASSSASGMGGMGGCGAGPAAWATRAGDGEIQSSSMVVRDAADNAFITGLFKGTIDLGGGPLASAGDFDFFVAKLDASGKHVWSKRFGGPGFDAA